MCMDEGRVRGLCSVEFWKPYLLQNYVLPALQNKFWRTRNCCLDEVHRQFFSTPESVIFLSGREDVCVYKAQGFDTRNMGSHPASHIIYCASSQRGLFQYLITIFP